MQAGDASNSHSSSNNPAYELVIEQGAGKINIDNDETPLLKTEEEVFNTSPGLGERNFYRCP